MKKYINYLYTNKQISNITMMFVISTLKKK